MAIFSSTPVTLGPATYDDVVASLKSLVAQLDANSAAFTATIESNTAQIATLQASSAQDTADKAKADDLSAKLKALLPPEPAPPVA